MLAQLKDISLSFPDKSVLDEVSLTVDPADRIALVGENGSGKTSLFRVLTGAIKPDVGEISVARGTTVGHLEQDLAGLEEESRSCLEVALEPFEDLVRLEERIERLGAELAVETEEDKIEQLLTEFGTAQQSLEATGGYGFRVRAEATLTGLGLPESRWERSVQEFSSGEKTRLALARLLLGEHDLLLLDEPTNHLDTPDPTPYSWLSRNLDEHGCRSKATVCSVTSGVRRSGFVQFDETILFGEDSLQLQHLELEENHLSLSACTTTKAATCPICGDVSGRVHSRYWRTISDLPWHGTPVTLHLRVQRFFCEQYGCRRVIFAERIPEVAGDYARKTERLQSALSAVGLSLGGEAGSRLAEKLGLISSPDTLLRRVRSAPLSETGEVRALGVDDWAFRRGSSGTILVDLEKHRPIDLLEGSQASTFAEWLRSHPEVEFISRDRGGAYADAARQEAPQAVQILDRWHLLKNLSEHLQNFVDSHRSLVEQAAGEVRDKQVIDASLSRFCRDDALLQDGGREAGE